MSDIEEAFAAAIGARTINGAVLCATDATGGFTSTHVLGKRVLLSGQCLAQSIDDIICLASATKLITTTAALQCVEDGLLSLRGDELSRLLPELTSKKLLVGHNDDGKEVYKEYKRNITLEMLLTHSAGTSYPFADPNLARFHAERSAFRPGNEGKLSVEEAYIYPLAYEPGQGWMYGFGVDWAGRAVERATGRPLLQFMRERIFSPLGIEDACFYPVTDEALKARQVDRNPDDRNGTGVAVMGAEAGEGQRYTNGAFGGHGLSMTAGGYLRVLRALLVNDGKLLGRETVDEMFASHLGAEADAAFQAVLGVPELGASFRAGVGEGRELGFGLGGVVVLDEPGDESEDGEWRCREGTLAWGGGNTLAWFVDRKEGLCGVGAVQGVIPTDVAVAGELKDVFRRGVYKEFRESKWSDGRISTHCKDVFRRRAYEEFRGEE